MAKTKDHTSIEHLEVPKDLFNYDPDLELKDVYISIHALNPFVPNLSSPRGYMMGQHLSQSLTIMNGDEKIIQTGLEKQLGDNTFSKRTEDDTYIHKIIKRYESVSSAGVDKEVERLFIVEKLSTGEIDYINVPTYYCTHQRFGFEYRWNTELIDNLRKGVTLEKGTILADSPTKTKNSGYKVGVNANVALMTLKEVAEDGVVISTDLAEKLAFCSYEKRVVEFGTDRFPLNLYGDEKTYKPFPEIGEKINQDGVVMALRDYDTLLSPALTSVKDTMNFDPTFDKPICVRGPGKEIKVQGKTYVTSVVEDIKVYKSPKFQKDVYKGTADNVDKYAESLRRYYEEIIQIYERLLQNHYVKFKNYDLPLTPRFHRLVIEAYAIVNPNSKSKINFTFKNVPIDLYRIEFVIKHIIIPDVPGFKLSDFYGSKGVIVHLKKPEEMPYIKTPDGQLIRADIIMDPGSVISRMNPGRLYEQYFNGSSRRCQYLIQQAMGGKKLKSKYTDKEIDAGWKLLLEFISVFETEQIDYYAKLRSKEDKLEILLECIFQEVHIYYKMESKKKPIEIVRDMERTIFKPVRMQAYIPTNGKEVLTNKDILIAPIYTILLAKTADEYLSVASAKTNHYGLPIKVNNVGADYLHYKNSPTKILSETETRLFAAYVGRQGLIEIKDRANSIETHKHMYANILNAPKPTNVDSLVDRSVQPYGTDNSMELIDYIFNAAGLSIDFVNERR